MENERGVGRGIKGRARKLLMGGSEGREEAFERLKAWETLQGSRGHHH